MPDAQSNGLKREEYYEIMAICAEQTRIKDTAVGKIRAALKRATDAGEPASAVAEIRKMAKLPDETREAHYASLAKMAGYERIQLWKAGTDEQPQGALMDMPEQVAPSTALAEQAMLEARAFCHGYDCCKAGGLASLNPHTPGDAEYVSWQNGWVEYGVEFGEPPVKQADAKPRGGRQRAAEAAA